MQRLLLIVAILAMACSLTLNAQTAVPRKMTYQGFLTYNDAKGKIKLPKAGPYNLTFKLFDAPTSGTQQGPDMSYTGIAVGKTGAYTVTIGEDQTTHLPAEGNFINSTDKLLWLEITVVKSFDIKHIADGTVLPRVQLTTVPYASEAGNIDPNASLNVQSVATKTITGLTTPLSVDQGGTGAADATMARTNLSAAASGANADITALSGLTTPVSMNEGGTGANSFTAGSVLFGNGTGLAQNNSKFFWDATNYRLGIGTITPSTPLQVQGVIYSTTGGFKFPDGTTQTTAATGGGGGGSVTNVSANLPLSVTNPTTTPNITLGTVPVANGGTGATDATTARTNLTAAASGANADITALSGLTTPLSMSEGGTGANSFTAGSVLFGNGTGLAQNNSKLFWDATNFRLGIGTITPSTPLQVQGVIYSSTGGFKFPDGTTQTTAAGSSGWSMTGNGGTTQGTNFVGTTDAQGFDIRTNNALRTRITTKGQIETYNTGQSVFLGEGAGANDNLANNGNVFLGYHSGYANSTGTANTGSGFGALSFNTTGTSNTAGGSSALYFNTTGNNNTANGTSALFTNTTGTANNAFGVNAMYSNTTGNNNTASGTGALFANTTGTGNTAGGNSALSTNTVGNNNMAIGFSALSSNAAGSNATAVGTNAMQYANSTNTPYTNDNVAVGFEALRGSTTASSNTGASNTALGYQTLWPNTSGNNNTASGLKAMNSNTTGSTNTASGSGALSANTVGSSNTASGYGALYFNVAGSNATAVGTNAMQYANNTAIPFLNNNVAVGFEALRGSTFASSNTGNINTALGFQTLWSNTSGNNNTASGSAALFANTTGSGNMASGVSTLSSNTVGSSNTAGGYGALYSNVAGSNATALGTNAMQYANSTNTPFTNYNVAVGFEALRGSTTASSNTGTYNTALGYQSLWSNTSGNYNTASGYGALSTNTTGFWNTANGYGALSTNTTGNYNTANGSDALIYGTIGSNNTACGFEALTGITSEDDNTGLGAHAGSGYNFTQGTFVGSNAYPSTSGYTNVMGLGYNARPTASNQIRIGNSSVTSIGGNANWTNFSDGRFKKNILENVKGLDFIMKLRPITYNLDSWKLAGALKEDQRTDKDNRITTVQPDEQTTRARNERAALVQSGFVAQEVEQAAKETGYDFSGVDAPKNASDIYGLRYSDFVAPLVKAIQEQQKMIDDLKKEIQELKNGR